MAPACSFMATNPSHANSCDMTTTKPGLRTRATRAKTTRQGTPDKTPAPAVDLTAAEPSSQALMPNDRDEKVGMTSGAQSQTVQQGARDLKRGLQDTSRATEANNAYAKLKK